ncbi:putative ribonuclease H protein, partial [Trifolium medium]|nr:putative ribonuclease H protein [Trifolium medium]
YDSPLWKALTGIWDKFQQNIVWNLGNGNHINFWLDKWTLSGDSLINTTSQPVINKTLSVRDVLNPTGDWNLNFLNDNLPINTVNQILIIPAPTDLDGLDVIGWGGTTTRHFTVQGAYKLQRGHYQPLDREWKALWDWIFKNITNHFNGVYEVDWIATFMVACWNPEAIEKVTLSTLVGKDLKKGGSSSTVMDLKMIKWPLLGVEETIFLGLLLARGATSSMQGAVHASVWRLPSGGRTRRSSLGANRARAVYIAAGSFSAAQERESEGFAKGFPPTSSLG